MTTLEKNEVVDTNLPPKLAKSQQAVLLPEVQEMIRKLSEHNLGVVMLHGHDETTGHFTEFPEGKMQVESDLKVTFEEKADIQARMDEFVAVGWQWQGDGVTGMMACNTVCKKRGTDTNHYSVHEKNA